MSDSSWDDLVIERAAHPAALTDQEFRDWMTGRRIFVSSLMDEEMTPFRSVMRHLVEQWGGVAVMWETITPRDERANIAYLEGVRASDLFLLTLGRRYGIPDESGYSPTHKESDLAAKLGRTRLAFNSSAIKSSDRDGKLNDWIGALYTELSLGKYHDAETLENGILVRLRETAAQQETYWVKIGRMVFPASVISRTSGDGTVLTVTATLRDRDLKRELLRLQDNLRLASRLTWGAESTPVNVKSVVIEDRSSSRFTLELVCGVPRDRYNGGAMWEVSSDEQGRRFGPADQMERFT